MDKFPPALPVPEGVPDGQLRPRKVFPRSPALPRGLASRDARRIRRYARIKTAALWAALAPFRGHWLDEETREAVYRAVCDVEAAVARRHGHLLPPPDLGQVSVRRDGDRLVISVL